MSKPRIPVKATELRDLMYNIAAGINANPGWPGNAPTANDYLVLGTQANSLITTVNTIKAQLASAELALREHQVLQHEAAVKADDASTTQHGANSPKKLEYGIPPKKSTAGSSVPLDQVVITAIQKGRTPKSIFLDWDNEEGAGAYQLEVYTDSALTQIVHSCAVTESEYRISSLVQGQQYWVRVCAVRGSEQGPWSDVATEVAGL